jgi:pyruvate/2-oxoglutarate dehydrogenase complex dihydrolipoamide acyltransferase (E2) component
MSNLIEVKIPDIGGHSGVDVIEVFVKPGDSIKVDDALVTLETDKATMDVPSSAAGVVKEVKIAVGSKVSEGDVVLLLEAGAADAPAAPAAAPAPAAASTMDSASSRLPLWLIPISAIKNVASPLKTLSMPIAAI